MPWSCESDVEELNAELAAILAQRFHLLGGDRIEDGERERRGRDVVIDRRDGAVRAANLAARGAQTVKRLRRSDLVHQVQVDVEQRRLVAGLANYVRVPDFLEQVCVALTSGMKRSSCSSYES